MGRKSACVARRERGRLASNVRERERGRGREGERQRKGESRNKV